MKDPLLITVVHEDVPLGVESFYFIPAQTGGGTSVEEGCVPVAELAEAICVPLPPIDSDIYNSEQCRFLKSHSLLEFVIFVQPRILRISSSNFAC
jgi:hypothetical protein